jgi:hypothetical protein
MGSEPRSGRKWLCSPWELACPMQINPHATEPAKTEPQPVQAVPPERPNRRRLRARIDRGIRFLHGKETLLWWLHSGYALLLGLGVMWLGARDFTYLRLIIFHISFIWLSSLLLPFVVNLRRLTPKWRERARMTINYFNKNFYQQLLFFLLPIYYASTTVGSRNMAFLVLLAVSAVLSTMDVVYDRYVSVRWQLTAVFFMFNLFASINVMLPVLWTVSNHRALWVSGVLAFGGFASMVYRLSGLRGARVKWLLGAAACALLLIVEFLPPFIPPAPLTLARAEFGRSVRARSIVTPLDAIPSSPGRIAVLTAIKAPMGLKETVRHRWTLDGKVVYVSNYFSVTGGRKEGYRLSSQITWKAGTAGHVLVVDVETQSGQLIGRARLRS